MELTALEDLREKGISDPFCKSLADIVEANDGIWNKEAEDYVLRYGTPI